MMNSVWKAVVGKSKGSDENSKISNGLYSGSPAQGRSQNRTSFSAAKTREAGPASTRHLHNADNKYYRHRQRDPPVKTSSSTERPPRTTKQPGACNHERGPGPSDVDSQKLPESDVLDKKNNTLLADTSSRPLEMGQETSFDCLDPSTPSSSDTGSVTTDELWQGNRKRPRAVQTCEECELCYASQEIDTLKKNLKEAQAAHYEAVDSLRQAQSEVRNLENQLRQANHQFQSVMKGNAEVEARLQDECSHLRKMLQKSESEIGNLQRTELAMFHRRQPLMDEKAKDDLRDRLRVKVQAISRPHFRKSSWRMSAEKHLNLDQIFPEMFASGWALKGHWPSICDHPDFSTTAFVDAVLFSIITTKFFKNPFFRTEHNPAFKNMLDKVYLQSNANGIGDANSWREKTASLLKGLSLTTNPLLPELTDDNPSSDLIINQTSDKILALLSTFKSLYTEVTPSELTKLSDKVEDLVHASAALAEDWHCNEFRVVIIDLDWLKDNQVEWRSELGSKYCTPKNKTLEENVNYDLVAVISPGFIRYQRGDNSGQEVEIVWEKAMVLVDEVQGCTIGDFRDGKARFEDADPMETDAWHGA
ncbi:hypothetical protein TWF730_007342 [Orbilia blumenaviensis]|uniref:Uncharacterized protein n=1 Tax=Orbilia blumenaviensis TaxID=1796055 RepID=A0AAV9V8N2_9PEZI